MKERVFSDPEIGQVRIVKSARSRRISIRVHPLRGVAVSVPYFLKYDDGIRFFLQKKEWVKEALVRQRLRQDVAEKTGGAVGVLRDGVTVRTLLSEIRFHRTSACRSWRSRTSCPGCCAGESHNRDLGPCGRCQADRTALSESGSSAVP